MWFTKSRMARKGAKKLELMGGAEPPLSLTPVADLEESSKGPPTPQPHSLGLQERFYLQLSLNLAAGWGPWRQGPNRCWAAAAPWVGGGERRETGWRPGLSQAAGGGGAGPKGESGLRALPADTWTLRPTRS